MGLISRLGKLSAEGGLMLKGPVLNLSVLHSSVFQDRPDRGRKIFLKKVLKTFLKNVENIIYLVKIY